MSPQKLYDILNKALSKEGVKKPMALSGLGRKRVSEVAMTLQISTAEFIEQLKGIGVEATPEDKFKTVVEKYDLSPMDVMVKLGYKK